MDSLGLNSGQSSNARRRILPSPPPVSRRPEIAPRAGADTASVGSNDTAFSCFGDRRGFLNPPDTLSVSLASLHETNRVALFGLAEIAVEKKFNLHANVAHGLLAGTAQELTDTLGLRRDETLSDATTMVLRGEGNETTITLHQPGRNAVIDWPEDILFMGRNSAHRRTSVFEGLPSTDVEAALAARRQAAWKPLGISNPRSISKQIGYGNRPNDHVRGAQSTKVASMRGGVAALRTIPTSKSIEAAIDGGNILCNGAKPGGRIFLIGLDSLELTRIYRREDGQSDDVAVVKQHIAQQLGSVEGDRVIYVEQPSFHIDMSMGFTGAKEVVVNSSLKALKFRTREKSDAVDFGTLRTMQKIENQVADVLEAEGLTVIRKPWFGGGKSFSFFNGELVSSHDGKTVFVTNGYYDGPTGKADRTKVEELERDVVNFYRERDIDVAFLPGEKAGLLLERFGGIGCQANSLGS